MLSPGQTLRRFTSEKFINAGPTMMDDAGANIPAIVISFGDVDGPIFDRLVSSSDARDMVVDLLQSLSSQGDTIASHLLDVLEWHHSEADESEFNASEES